MENIDYNTAQDDAPINRFGEGETPDFNDGYMGD